MLGTARPRRAQRGELGPVFSQRRTSEQPPHTRVPPPRGHTLDTKVGCEVGTGTPMSHFIGTHLAGFSLKFRRHRVPGKIQTRPFPPFPRPPPSPALTWRKACSESFRRTATAAIATACGPLAAEQGAAEAWRPEGDVQMKCHALKNHPWSRQIVWEMGEGPQGLCPVHPGEG